MVSAAPENAACFSALEFGDVGGEDEGLVCWGDAVVPEMIDAVGDDRTVFVGDFTAAIAIEFFDAFGELAQKLCDRF